MTEPAVRAHHVAGFRRKPVDNDVLLDTIRDALESRFNAYSPGE